MEIQHTKYRICTYMSSVSILTDHSSQRIQRLLIRSQNMGWSSSNYSFWKEFKLFLSNINILKDKKNWLTFMSLLINTTYFWLGIYYLVFMFSLETFAVGYCYSLLLVYHQTVWYHRFASHGAFKFKNLFWTFFHRFIFLKMFIEERYVIAHRVHHALSDCQGDPYTPRMGFWYILFSEYNNVSVSRTLSENEFNQVASFVERTTAPINTYEDYKRFGTISKPVPTIFEHLLNLILWSTVFWWLGGIELVFVMLGAVYLGHMSIRMFNFIAHGGFKNIDREGSEDLSLNQLYFGLMGEWHHNHHRFPKSARSGYEKYQLDIPWLYIKLMSKLGVIEDCNNQKSQYQKVKNKLL